MQSLQSDTPEYQEGCGVLHRCKGKARYDEGKLQQNPYPYWRDAYRSYQQALNFLTTPNLRQRRLEVLQDTIKVCRALDKTTQVQALLAEGTDLLGRLLQETPSDAVKIRLSQKFASFDQLRVDEIAQAGNWCAALELAEQRKNLCLTWMQNRWSESVDSPNYAQMQQLLAPVAIQLSRKMDKYSVTLPIGRQSFGNKAIVYWHISPAAITTFILKYNQPPIILSAKNGESGSVFSPSLSDLDPLHNLFDLPSPLVGQGQGVRGNFTIAYLPSIKVGLNRTYPKPNTSLLSVENPTEDLRYASQESESICQIYPNAHRLAKSAATKTAVKIALAQNFGIFHFTGHSTHNTKQPAESALILANEERLTLKDILELDLSNYNLACLCSCETNFTSKVGLIDEFIGLASGFVAAGVNNVIGSLWGVDDRSTAYLMTKFHNILTSYPHKDVPSALKEAQDWLRNATNAELDQFPIHRSQVRNFGILSDQEIAENRSPNHKPFASPYHWAGFCAIGL